MSVLGIDLSLTGTGLALIGDLASVEYKYGKLPLATCHVYYDGANTLVLRLLPEHSNDYYRWNLVREYLIDLIRPVMTNTLPAVVIEGYAYGSPFNREALAELGGIVRWTMRQQYGITPTVVAPTTLKRFLLGSGKGEKELMLKECFKRYHADFNDNNMCDAYVLAKIGEAMQPDFDLSTLPQFQADIINQLKNPKPKKARKAKA